MKIPSKTEAPIRPQSSPKLNVEKLRAEPEIGLFGIDAMDAALEVEDAILKANLALVPTVASIEMISAGHQDPGQIAQALKTALLSPQSKVRQKGLRTLQVAEAYQRKAATDAANFRNPSGNPFTGFVQVNWPGLQILLSEDETLQLQKNIKHDSPQHAGILLMSIEAGLVRTNPRGALQLPDDKTHDFRLPGSQGLESPRGGSVNFVKEFDEHVRPGISNIGIAQALTAKRNTEITGAKCPYAHGNHAKGIALSDVQLNLERDAPEWARDLFGSRLDGGMLRVSGSMTDPLQPDSEPHQPGIRLVLPVKSRQGVQLIDLTANGGDTTHAQTADRHTAFTLNTSLPRSGALDVTPLRAAKHLVKEPDLLQSTRELFTAVSDSKSLNRERFHEHLFFSRHAYFVGGRYVQIRFAVEGPKTFPNAAKSSAVNAQIDAVSTTVANEGLKLSMYITELPPSADPGLIEKEYGEKNGWQGLPEYKLATIDVPAQTAQKESAATKWFAHVPHVPGGDDKLFKAQGLGRERLAVYAASGLNRVLTTSDLGDPTARSASDLTSWAIAYMKRLGAQRGH